MAERNWVFIVIDGATGRLRGTRVDFERRTLVNEWTSALGFSGGDDVVTAAAAANDRVVAIAAKSLSRKFLCVGYP